MRKYIIITVIMSVAILGFFFGDDGVKKSEYNPAIVGESLFDSGSVPVYEICDTTKAKRTSIIDDLNNFKGKNVDGSLRALNSKEVADLKGCEIAKLHSVPRTTVGNYDIEIVDIEKKEKGITVYVRAWDANGQIGFGKDGTVDIERVNITNPPIAYVDPAGVVISEYVDEDGNVFQKKVIEDPKEALLRDLAHTLSVKRQKHDSSKIVQGKIGSTTTTLNPNAAPESTSVDGQATSGEGSNWDTLHDLLTGASADDDDAGNPSRLAAANLAGGPNYLITRGIVVFDGSAISGADTVDTAVMSFFGTGEAEASSDGPDIDIVDSTPAANTAVTTADYDQVGAVDNPTVYASLLLSNWDETDGTANNFTLDAAGEAKIATALDGDGILKFGVRTSLDSDDTAPTVGENKVQPYWADQTGASIPKLVIEHTAGVVPEDDPSSPFILIQ